ncbi:hypothetical protein BDSB_08970 [Burkholderia dolosa PC543]|nr:hypothetical protein BDSB_08970 [Burkholderia dolosa PC543]
MNAVSRAGQSRSRHGLRFRILLIGNDFHASDKIACDI